MRLQPASIEETLEKMGLDYLDQMIIHAPQPWNEFRDTKRYFAENKAVWRALEDAQAAGKVRVIGVSNFLQDDLENLLSDCRIQPMVNQILLHISNTDHDLLNFCKEQHIQVEAYSPIAHGEALKNPVIAQMAKKYGVSAAQLCVRYVLQLGAVALPKTADPQHMEENAAVDFVLTPGEYGLHSCRWSTLLTTENSAFSRCSAGKSRSKRLHGKEGVQQWQ